MHYANNQNAFTHGMGGYFSPQGYFLGNVPFTWSGHYINRWHYNIMGAVGAQAFQEDSTPLWPLAGDKPLETSQNNPMLPNVTSVSAQLRLSQPGGLSDQPALVRRRLPRGQQHAQLHLHLGRLLRPLHVPRAALHSHRPTGLFPWDGIRPFTVP